MDIAQAISHSLSCILYPHFVAMELRGKRVLVMGLGVHGGGLGVARFLVGQGADVTVTDLRSPAQLSPSLDALAGLPIRYVLGEHREEDFRNADLVVRNPGVPRESHYLQIARAAGAVIEMEMTLFFRLCPGPILGITGTKGKTTTTLLAGAMIRAQYPDTVVAGNLRVSALEALPQISAGTPVVLELSSWQLEGLGEAHLSPRYACITNISADHLDRYGSMDVYIEAKEQIWLHQKPGDVVVLNANDQTLNNMGVVEFGPGDVAWFADTSAAWRDDLQERYTPNWVAYWQDNALIWQEYGDPQQAGYSREEVVCRLEDIRLLGQHNLANIAAATTLAKRFGIETEHIRNAICAFTGVPHRLEFVREWEGVRYINDTTATAPEAAIAALRSFEEPIVLICGGADKNLPFDDLARAIVGQTKAVVLLKGTATPKLEQELRMKNEELRKDASAQFSILNSQFSILGPFDDFTRAIVAARDLAAPGDVVLLSPGCASFGMFQNEFQRGDEFKRIVNTILDFRLRKDP
jgi:UDP-N-acetylmuramoylalanine--D-glutamate ligase